DAATASIGRGICVHSEDWAATVTLAGGVGPGLLFGFDLQPVPVAGEVDGFVDSGDPDVTPRAREGAAGADVVADVIGGGTGDGIGELVHTGRPVVNARSEPVVG